MKVFGILALLLVAQPVDVDENTTTEVTTEETVDLALDDAKVEEGEMMDNFQILHIQPYEFTIKSINFLSYITCLNQYFLNQNTVLFKQTSIKMLLFQRVYYLNRLKFQMRNIEINNLIQEKLQEDSNYLQEKKNEGKQIHFQINLQMKAQSESVPICQIHSIAIESQSLNQQEEPQCPVCTKQNEDDGQNQEEIKKQCRKFQQDIKNKTNVINSLLVQIDKIQIIIQENLDKLSDYLKLQIQEIKVNEEKFKKSYSLNKPEFHNNVQIEIQTLSKNLQLIQQNLKKKLMNLNFQQHVDSLIQYLKVEWDPSQKLSKEQNCFYPVLKNQLQGDQYQYCQKFSFNYDDKIVVAGGINKIMIYEFNSIHLVLKNEVTENSLAFVQFFPTQENIFVSGHNNRIVKVWKLAKDYSIILHNELDVKCNIDCMECSQDQLVISDYKCMIFYKFSNSTLTNLQSIKLESYIRCFSMNSKLMKLACSVDLDEILIFEFDGKLWNIIQKFVGLKLSSQLKMLDEHLVLLSAKSNILEVYKYIDGNYEKDQDINLRKLKGVEVTTFPICCFQSGFICKYFKFLIFFSFTKGNKLQLDYFPFESQGIYGCASSNNKYLLVNDWSKHEIKVFWFEEELDN